MPLKWTLCAGLIGLLVAAWCAGQEEAPIVELQSVALTVLKDREQDRFLASHDAARKAVGVDPLAWSDELSAVARDWLSEQQDRLIEEAKEGWTERRIVLPAHRPDNQYGENVAGWAGASAPGAERVVAWWLSEQAAFDKLNADGSYEFGDEMGKTEIDAQGNERPVIVGHYTQVVWKATRRLGAAKLTFVLKDDRGTIRTYMAVVCNYDPAGNVEGQQPF